MRAQCAQCHPSQPSVRPISIRPQSELLRAPKSGRDGRPKGAAEEEEEKKKEEAARINNRQWACARPFLRPRLSVWSRVSAVCVGGGAQLGHNYTLECACCGP